MRAQVKPKEPRLWLSLPIRTTNPLNGSQGVTRGAMLLAARKRAEIRFVVRAAVLGEAAIQNVSCAKLVPGVVTLSRLSSRRLDDDGLRAALKSVRDGVADALRVNDGSSDIEWSYEQGGATRGRYAVEIRIDGLGTRWKFG